MELWKLNDLQIKIVQCQTEGNFINDKIALENTQRRSQYLSNITNIEEDIIKEFISISYEIPREPSQNIKKGISIPEDIDKY